MKKRLGRIGLLMGIAWLFIGCREDIQQIEIIEEPTVITSSPEEVEETKSPHPNWILPEVENTSGKVQIQTVSGAIGTPYNSYVLTSIEGETIVLDPTVMPLKEVVDLNPAAIISTHGHEDHIDSTYMRSYDCEVVIGKETKLDTRDFKIKTVQSSHKGNEIDPNDFNVITIVEVDGIKIAHLGDLGQDHLTNEQLEALEDVDIIFMQIENKFSDMDLENKKGIQLINDINPAIAILTHHTEDAIPVLEEEYGEVIQVENILDVDRQIVDQIKEEGKIKIYRILNNHKYDE